MTRAARPSKRDGERPPPVGGDTGILSFLTSVGGEPPPSIDRLFMRLRIFYFFFVAGLPTIVGAALVAGLVGAAVQAIVGDRPGLSWLITAAPLVAFAVAAVILVRLMAHLFNRLTARYRANLERRAREQASWRAAAAARPTDRTPAPSLAELDARLASADPGRKRTD